MLRNAVGAGADFLGGNVTKVYCSTLLALRGGGGDPVSNFQGKGIT